MLHRFVKFLALGNQQKRFFLQAFYLLGKVKLEIRSTPLKELIAGFDAQNNESVGNLLDTDDLDLVRTTSWAVQAAANVAPWENTCLIRVLAAQRILEKKGIGGVFYLGADIEPDDRNENELSAHAWLKCGSEFVTGESGHEKYTVITSFSWTG